MLGGCSAGGALGLELKGVATEGGKYSPNRRCFHFNSVHWHFDSYMYDIKVVYIRSW